jgi:hypothetical protein
MYDVNSTPDFLKERLREGKTLVRGERWFGSTFTDRKSPHFDRH